MPVDSSGLQVWAAHQVAPSLGDVVLEVGCGGGIAAALDAFLLHQLGYRDVAVYDASMSEWATDETLPIERG